MKYECYDMVKCPHCGTEDDEKGLQLITITLAGKTVICTTCGKPFVYQKEIIHCKFTSSELEN